jgi:hypothetical protein
MMAALSQLPQDQSTDLSIAQFFSKLQDPRRVHRRLHSLQDIIDIALCAVIVGAQDWQQIETFGRKRRDWPRGFLALPNGIPSHDTFERVFDRLQPRAFQACFQEWVQAVRAALRIKHVAIDGKTLRGSGSAKPASCPRRRRAASAAPRVCCVAGSSGERTHRYRLAPVP